MYKVCVWLRGEHEAIVKQHRTIRLAGMRLEPSLTIAHTMSVTKFAEAKLKGPAEMGVFAAGDGMKPLKTKCM